VWPWLVVEPNRFAGASVGLGRLLGKPERSHLGQCAEWLVRLDICCEEPDATQKPGSKFAMDRVMVSFQTQPGKVP
jgi:hypothetical protein